MSLFVRQLATKQVNVMIKEFKNRLEMGLGNAYNVQALVGQFSNVISCIN